MRYKLVLSTLIMALLAALLTPAASAKTIDCTAKGSVRGCPHPPPKQPTGQFAGKFLLVGTPQADVINGTRADVGDLIQGGGGNDRITGERGNDAIFGGPGNDRLDGSGDNDVLDGGPGNDTLGADSGRDRLIGGVGNDTYVIPKGSHQIADSQGTETLRLPQAKVQDTSFERIGPDLVMRWVNGEVRIQNHYGNGNIERIILSGGEVVRIAPDGRSVDVSQLSNGRKITNQQAQETANSSSKNSGGISLSLGIERDSDGNITGFDLTAKGETSSTQEGPTEFERFVETLSRAFRDFVDTVRGEKASGGKGGQGSGGENGGGGRWPDPGEDLNGNPAPGGCNGCP